jgi:hypothetical protein
MAGGNGWPHPEDQLLVAVSRAAPRQPATKGRVTTGRTAPLHREIFGIFSGQRVDSIQQVLLACDSGDLIAQLAVLEKE